MNEDEKTVKKTKTNVFVKKVGLIAAILILSSGVAFFMNLNDEAGDELIKDKTLGERLDDAGWMLYTKEGCGACGEQRVILGTAIRDIKVIDVQSSEENNTLFFEQGFTLIPTWHNVFSNETRVGAQTREQLEEMAR